MAQKKRQPNFLDFTTRYRLAQWCDAKSQVGELDGMSLADVAAKYNKEMQPDSAVVPANVAGIRDAIDNPWLTDKEAKAVEKSPSELSREVAALARRVDELEDLILNKSS